MQATLIKTTGERIDIKPADGDHFSYEELKGFVGGMIEIVPMPSGKFLVCNEEGKLIGLPTNTEATKVWKEEYPIEKYPHNNDELVVGDVLITDREFIR